MSTSFVKTRAMSETKETCDFDALLQDPEESRYVYRVKYEDVHRRYKEHMSTFWTVEEIDFSSDKEDFALFSRDEKHFLLNTLAFFAASDGIVLENLIDNFTSEIVMPEARAFLTFQAMMEGVHSETYAKLLELLSEDEEQFNSLVNAIHDIPAIKAKADFAKTWMNPERVFAERLVAFVCVEGILFSGSFASIFWMKQHKKGKCPGLAFSNELISRDEGLHTNFGIHLFQKYVKNKPSSDKVREIILQAVDCEIAFIIGSFNCKLIGMNAEQMETYIQYVASEICEQLIDEPLYKKKPINPFEWMNAMSLDGKTNFFEKKVSEYNKSGVLNYDDSNVFNCTLNDF
jgi:ribonucleoside-diphosphate reductase subunit M2|tara:strand:+ start:4460 stop:5497 length:1038 start_codon:yes stop_codon:yes gene_type:complete